MSFQGGTEIEGKQARFKATLVALAVTSVALAWLARPPYEITRIRNAMIAAPATAADLDWTPDAPPPGFLREMALAPDTFRAVADAIAPPGRDPLGKALAIASHLQGGPGRGPGILSTTSQAYDAIRSEERGYCADYTQVFNGLAHAANLGVREWGMSFDGFSGNGHAFSEVFDPGARRWIFIDSFHSFRASDRRSGTPLSVQDLMRLLRTGAGVERIEVLPIVPERFAFKGGEKALEYYRRGSNQFFIWTGNNVFSYDAHPLVRFFGPVSRALEQAAAILAGVHPQIRIVVTGENQALIDGLERRKVIFLTGCALWFVLCVAALVQWRILRRRRRRTLPAAGSAGAGSAS